MNGFYQNIITQKSWQLLKDLKKQSEFILIGGWAVWLYTQTLKSKDIDIIVDYGELQRLKNSISVIKNDRLKKYEAKNQGVDIDIYLPYYSRLGLPVEKLSVYKTLAQGFSTLIKEALLITKQRAYQERKTSVKGQKDKIDILALLFLEDFDFSVYRKILKKYQLLAYQEELKTLLNETTQSPELGLNQHHFSRKKKMVLERL